VMKFLLDSTLSHRVAQLLCDAGSMLFTFVTRVCSTRPTQRFWSSRGSTHLFSCPRTPISVNCWLGSVRRRRRSCCCVRTYDPLTPDEQAAVLLANLLRLRDDLEQGAIVVIERSRLRVRRLPVLPPIPPQRER
jgi:predicted nuclease of predicted toxin-antitoxin system